MSLIFAHHTIMLVFFPPVVWLFDFSQQNLYGSSSDTVQISEQYCKLQPGNNKNIYKKRKR